jgi:hypothetical protein
MSEAAESMTDEEILQAGHDALVRELGLVGMIRFLQMLRPGKGDYTAERHAWLDKLSIDDITGGSERQRARSGRRTD